MNAEVSRENPELFSLVFNICKKLCVMKHNEFLMSVIEGLNINELLLSVSSLNNIINTAILVEKDTVRFSVDCCETTGREIVFDFTAPADVGYFRENYAVIFGFCGFVQEVGIRNSLVINDLEISKQEYDGVRDYTTTSGSVNRYLRGQGIEDMSLEERGSVLRTISNCDRLFNKSYTRKSFLAFRGQVRDKCFDGVADYNSIEGSLITNTAYNSMSLSIMSAVYFASAGTNCDNAFGKDQSGVIYVYRVPVGTRAVYVHNIAGWNSQYEILLDRCYDTRVGKTLLEFDDSLNNHYKVVEACLVEHAVKTEISVDYTDDILYSAFNRIREIGFSDIQYNPGIKGDVSIRPSIVLRARTADDDGMFVDSAFELSNGNLEVHKLRTSGVNRGDHANAVDQRYAEYGLVWNMLLGQNVDFDYDLYNKDIETLSLREGTSYEIASRIINYAKSHENLCLLPLIDVARYFDMVFSHLVINAGYELVKSIRVERVCSDEDRCDPQAGVVFCSYQISVDNDNILEVSVSFYKNSDNVVLEYSCLDSSFLMSLDYSIFDSGVMNEVAVEVLEDVLGGEYYVSV